MRRSIVNKQAVDVADWEGAVRPGGFPSLPIEARMAFYGFFGGFFSGFFSISRNDVGRLGPDLPTPLCWGLIYEKVPAAHVRIVQST
jgi:hypothetical protein